MSDLKHRADALSSLMGATLQEATIRLVLYVGVAAVVGATVSWLIL